MLTLYKKEISLFLSSLIGYIVIIVFLLINSLFLWVFPVDSNILSQGYATIEGLFIQAPFVFLFLIPAITMRSFSEEKRSGTLELLLTKPLTDMQIISSKFLSGLTLVVFSLLPTLIYVVFVYLYGSPVGNIDMGGTWGSYIGLLFLASAFVAIGIFVSSITDNQIVSFIVSVFLCGFILLGFEFLYTLNLFGPIDLFIKSLGIQAHYVSMSRGVIDSRDVMYFLSLIILFLLMTKTSLESRKW